MKNNTFTTCVFLLILLVGCYSYNFTKVKCFKIEGMPTFYYPYDLQILPDSGKGESLWSYKLKSSDNTFVVETKGFFNISYDALLPGETTNEYILRVFGQSEKNDLFLSIKKEHDFIIIERRTKTKFVFYKIYLHKENPIRQGINMLIIIYETGKKDVLYNKWKETIEQSWKPMIRE